MKVAIASIVIAVSLSASSVFAQRRDDRITITVVVPKTSGFVDPKDLDSTNDVRRELVGDKIVRLVPEDATSITPLSDFPKLYLAASRGIHNTEGANSIYYEALSAMLYVAPRTKLNEELKLIAMEAPHVALFSHVAGSGRWRAAARQIVKDLDAWVKANRERLLEQ